MEAFFKYWEDQIRITLQNNKNITVKPKNSKNLVYHNHSPCVICTACCPRFDGSVSFSAF